MTMARGSPPHALRARRGTGAGQRGSQAGVFRGGSESGAGRAAMEQNDDSAGTSAGVVALSTNGVGHFDQGLAADQGFAGANFSTGAAAG